MIEGVIELLVLLLLGSTGCIATISSDNWQFDNITGSIVGGWPAKEGKWPFVAALFALWDTPSPRIRAYCTGVLIKPDWIMSAAHCFSSGAIGVGSAVYIGQRDLSKHPNGRTAVLSWIVEIVSHPQFVAVEFGNDIALARLKYPVSIKPAALETDPGLFMEARKQKAWAVGYGYEHEDRQPARIQQEITQRLFPICHCYKLAKSRPFSNDVASRQLCYYPKKKYYRACYGDSGSPIIVPHRKSHQVVVRGILSYGTGCNSRLPDFYTRVSAYLLWIAETTGGLDSQRSKAAFHRQVSQKTWLRYPIGTAAHRWCKAQGFASGINLANRNPRETQYNVVCFPQSVATVLEANAVSLFNSSLTNNTRLAASEYARLRKNCLSAFLNGEVIGDRIMITCIRNSSEATNVYIDPTDIRPKVNMDTAGNDLASRLGFSFGIWTGRNSCERQQFTLIGSTKYSWSYTNPKNTTDRYLPVQCMKE